MAIEGEKNEVEVTVVEVAVAAAVVQTLQVSSGRGKLRHSLSNSHCTLHIQSRIDLEKSKVINKRLFYFFPFFEK